MVVLYEIRALDRINLKSLLEEQANLDEVQKSGYFNGSPYKSTDIYRSKQY